MSYETQLTDHYRKIHQRMLNPIPQPPRPKFANPRAHQPTITEVKVNPLPFEPLSPVSTQNLSSYQIMQLVAFATGTTIEEMRNSKRRKLHISRARQLAYYLIYKHTLAATPRIAVLMYKDHTSVLTGIRRAQELLLTSEAFQGYVKAVEDHMRIVDNGGSMKLCSSCPLHSNKVA